MPDFMKQFEVLTNVMSADAEAARCCSPVPDHDRGGLFGEAVQRSRYASRGDEVGGSGRGGVGAHWPRSNVLRGVGVRAVRLGGRVRRSSPTVSSRTCVAMSNSAPTCGGQLRPGRHQQIRAAKSTAARNLARGTDDVAGPGRPPRSRKPLPLTRSPVRRPPMARPANCGGRLAV